MPKASNTSLAKSTALVPARAALARTTSGELPAYVTKDEVDRALELLGDRVHAFVRALWLTGGRVSEVLGLKVADLDLRARTAHLATLKRRKPTVRAVPLPTGYLGELALLVNTEGLKAGDRLFPWSRNRAFEIVRDVLVAAGVDRERAHPHALRHGHAVHAVLAGVPLNIVQRQLGHALISTTSIYLAVTGEDVRRAYERIDW
jgi:integrase/recombinase XerD